MPTVSKLSRTEIEELNAKGNGRRQRTLLVRGIDPETRTVELAFSSDYERGERSFGIEILDHSPGAVNLERLRNRAPLLVNHSFDDQVGVVESARIDADRVGRAVVRFGTSARAAEVFQDVVDGIRSQVSVGYCIDEAEMLDEPDSEGNDVYRITRWTPYEISLVPVAFDPTVGVGRSLDLAPAIATRGNTLNMNRTVPTTAPESLGLAQLIAAARSAQDHHIIGAPGADMPVRLYPKPAAVTGSFRLSAALPALPAGDHARSIDLQSMRNAQVVMSLAVTEASRVMQAGAKLIPINAAPQPVQSDAGFPAWYTRPARFEVVTAPAFAVVADGDDVTTSVLPLATAEVGNWGDAASHAISFTLSRADQRNRTEAESEFIVARSLALGLAKVCDSVLLSAILAGTPTAFTLAKTASRGLRFEELRAICGTGAQGAAVGADGVLRVSGISAELTDASATSIIGAFGRAAIAIDDEVRVTIKRVSKLTDLEITAFVSIKPLIPTPDFWVAE
jgi:hypothetical protein